MSDREVTQQSEPVGEVVEVNNDGFQCEFNQRLAVGAKLYTTPPQQQAKPMAWDKPSDNFNEWWDGDRRRDTANPFTTDSFSYWAFEGWQAALAQPVQEPAAWMSKDEHEVYTSKQVDGHFQHDHIPLYTAPPLPVQRPWVGLTEQDMPSGEDPMFDHKYFIAGLVYAAKVLQEKNNG